MNKIISGLIVAASAAFVSPVAFACDPMHGGQFGENIFAAMDANKDGVVSKKEFEDFQIEHFIPVQIEIRGTNFHFCFRLSFPIINGIDNTTLIVKKWHAMNRG